MLFLIHILGLDSGNSSWYLFWSGICGDLFILGAVAGFYHKHNCHTNHCWRIGKHTVNGSPYCSRHKEVSNG